MKLSRMAFVSFKRDKSSRILSHDLVFSMMAIDGVGGKCKPREVGKRLEKRGLFEISSSLRGCCCCCVSVYDSRPTLPRRAQLLP